MTVSSSTAKVSYSGNGATQAFAVPFYFLADSQLTVTLRLADGSESTKVLGVDYTVTGAGVLTGGTVTMTVAPASGTTLVIVRNVPLTQETDLQPNDRLPAETLEQTVDKLTMITQQLDEAVDRSLKFPVTDSPSFSSVLPSVQNRAEKYLGFDASGNPTVAAGPATPYNSVDVSYIRGESGAVIRNVRDRLRDTVSVKDFGATGNGTTDDSAAIQAAVSANAGEVYFPAGTYLVSQPIQIPPNVSLRGAGKGATIIQGGTNISANFSAPNFASSVENKTALLNFNPGALPTQLPALSGNLEFGDNDIEFASAHGLVTGDIIFLVETSQRLIVESIASGPFTVGETITGSASGATGTIARVQVTGTSAYIDYIPVSGQFQPYVVGQAADNITGGTSGATATTVWRGASWNPVRREYNDGQFFVVSARINSTKVRINGSVMSSFYPTTTQVWKVNQPTKSSISKMSIVGSGDEDIRPYGVSVLYGHEFNMDDVEVRRFFYTNVELRLCFQSRIVNSVINQNFRYDSGAGSDFYGIAIANCGDIQIANCSASAARHAVTTGGYSSDPNLPNPKNTFINISDCTLSTNGEVQAADFHGNTAYSGYRDCSILGGVVLAGAYNSIQGCDIYGVSPDLQSSIAVYFSELASTGHRVVDNYISGTGTTLTANNGLIYLNTGIYERRGCTWDNSPTIFSGNRFDLVGGTNNGHTFRIVDSGYVGLDKGFSVIIDNNSFNSDNAMCIRELNTANYLPINVLTVSNNAFDVKAQPIFATGSFFNVINFDNNQINDTSTTRVTACCLIQAKQAVHVTSNTIRRASSGGFSIECLNTQTLPAVVSDNIIMDYGYNLNGSDTFDNAAFSFFRASGGTSEDRVFFSSNRVLSAQSTAQSAFRLGGYVDVIERNNTADFPAPSGGNWVSYYYVDGNATREYEDASYGDLSGKSLRSEKSTLTIVSGVVTATRSFHLIAGEGGAADDLVTINGGSDGQLLVLRAASDSVTITVKSTGNIVTAGSDVTLDNHNDTVTLMYDSDLAKWIELSRSNNGA